MGQQCCPRYLPSEKCAEAGKGHNRELLSPQRIEHVKLLGDCVNTEYNSMDESSALPGQKRLRPRDDVEVSQNSDKRFAAAELDGAGVGIKLLPLEGKIFGFIKQMVEEEKLGTTVRVAGGWVRDKCLGKESDDIDIAVDNMSGEEFAAEVVKFMVKKGEVVRSVGVIKANPDKSKHLATATFTLFGISIDCNNLRTEVYHDGSRVPETKVGTAEEDATRRDFTVNALFYNINTGKVEDLTKMGLRDLELQILRTPLEPLKTFLDDPLRVLRAIRFSARFNFKLEEKLVEAAKHPRISKDLAEKVSRERFSIEMNKVVGGVGSPTDAFKHLVDFGLHAIVFQEPANGLLIKDPDVKTAENPASLLPSSGIKTMRVMETLLKQRKAGKAIRQISLYAAFLHPYAGYNVKVKKRMIPAVRWILRESLKTADKDVAEAAAVLVDAANVFKQMSETLHQDIEGRPKVNKAMILRKTGEALLSVKERYPYAMDLCYAMISKDSAAKGLQADGENKDGTADYSYTDNKGLQAYANWVATETGLDGCWAWKPLVTAQDFVTELKVPKGPGMGIMMQRQTVWRLENPKGTKEELLQALADSLVTNPLPVRGKSAKGQKNKRSKKSKGHPKNKSRKGGK